MPFEQHQEKRYPKDAQSIYQAAMMAAQKMEAKFISNTPESFRFIVRFPKVIFGKTLGERTELTCEVHREAEGGIAIVDAYPLDAVERKLLFGARPGVTQTVVTWFIAHMENNLGLLQPDK